MTINFRYCHTHILHQHLCRRKSFGAGSRHRSVGDGDLGGGLGGTVAVCVVGDGSAK